MNKMRAFNYSEEENESFEHLSDLNLLMESKGKFRNMSRGQIRTLKRRGLVENTKLHGYSFNRYTDKGMKLLKKLNLIS
jgi:hypothetical protein